MNSSLYGYKEGTGKEDQALGVRQHPKDHGLAAINLREDDQPIEVKKTDNHEDVILVTKYGRDPDSTETDVHSTDRTSMGVIGMNLSDTDEIIAMQLVSQGRL